MPLVLLLENFRNILSFQGSTIRRARDWLEQETVERSPEYHKRLASSRRMLQAMGRHRGLFHELFIYVEIFADGFASGFAS